MLQKIKNNEKLRHALQTRHLGMYALALIAISMTWSSVKIIQKNYELQKQIVRTQQEVEILDQQTKNQELKNEYYKSDAYLDIAARKYFGKALPGEKLILVPKEVALSYISIINDTDDNRAKSNAPQFIKNWISWINFFLHRETNE